jgi:hypothetical protein
MAWTRFARHGTSGLNGFLLQEAETMRNILALIGAAVVVFGGLGWYLGWYQLGTTPSGDGHRQINVDLNTKKIADDVKKGEQKVSDVISKETKGTITPTPAPGGNTVPGQTTGFQFNPDGSVTIVPPKVEFKTGN